MALLDRRMAREDRTKDDDQTEMPTLISNPFSTGIPDSWPTPTPTMLSTSSSHPYSQLTSSTGFPAPTGESGGIFTSTNSKPNQPTYTGNPGIPEKGFTKQHLVAAAVLPLVFIGIVCGVFLCCLRRRRRRRAQQFAMHESKAVGTELEAAAGNKGPQVDAHQAAPFLQPQPAAMPVPRLQSEDHPIILAPLNPSSHAYYTGLDTSDVMSVTSTGTRATHMDEPPPPYRPRSIATAFSRDPSVRHPPQSGVATAQRKEESSAPRRSPFADPESDTMSELSEAGGSRRRRDEDEFSAVSDLSYQHDSLTSRPSVRK